MLKWCAIDPPCLRRSSRSARTCIHNELYSAWNGAVGKARRCPGVVGSRNDKRSHQKRSSASQVGEERGHGRCCCSLIGGEPRGGQEGASTHDGWPSQTVEKLASMDHPVTEEEGKQLQLNGKNNNRWLCTTVNWLRSEFLPPAGLHLHCVSKQSSINYRGFKCPDACR